MEQMGLFDAALGEAAKEEAVSRVEANASRAWLDAAWEAVRRLWLSLPAGTRVTSDEVWVALDGVTPPHEPRAMGVVMRRATREGLLRATSGFTPSALPQNHARPVRVYEVTHLTSAR
jgi:hypothetical protein